MKYFGWIFLFFIVVYIMPLGSRPMLNPYEFRNAETAREMVVSGGMTVPARSDLSCAEKLPLQRWLTVASFRLFGENSFANRFPSALAAGLTALLTALLIQQALRNEKLAALTAMVYMSCSLVFLAGTTSGGISTFNMFVTGTQGLLFLAAQENKFNRRKVLLLVLAGIFAGGGFLTGGFAALLLPALSLAAYLLFSRKWKEFLIMPLPVVIFAALTVLPWGMAVESVDAGFWHCIVNNDRFSGIFAGGGVPWWIAPVLIACGLFPAALFIPAALFPGREAWKNILKTDVCRFSICAFVIPLLYVCIMGKHPAWIIVCFPPAAVIISAGLQAYFNTGGHHRAYNWVMSVWGVVTLLTGIAALVFRETAPCLKCVLGKFPETILLTGGFAAFFCGALMLYSLLGNWRIRMYLFFFGLALLPLGISWCIPAVPPLMPEKFIEKFASDNAVIPAQTIVVSDAALRDAAAWTLKNSTVAEAENAADLINDPQRTKAVLCIVSPQTAKLLPREGFTHGAAVTCHDNSGVECRLYPVKKP